MLRSFSQLLALFLIFACWTGVYAADADQNSETAGVQTATSDDGEGGDVAPPMTQPMTLEERFHAAEWVSMVKIEGIGALINPTLSQSTNFTVMQAYSYSGSVLKDWKGGQPENIKFRVDLTDCKEALRRDGEYVVFGVINTRGGYQSMSCDDLIAAEDDASLIQTLDQFSLAQLAAQP